MGLHICNHQTTADMLYSYFVTELLGTDLHRLLTSRPLEKQFIQYFLYQILVRTLLVFEICHMYLDTANTGIVSHSEV